MQNEKRQGENEPYGKVFEAIVTNLFPPGHPYSWEVIGSMEDLNAASLDDVKTWFETYYGPNNATLVLAGDIDVATAREKVAALFRRHSARPARDASAALDPERRSREPDRHAGPRARGAHL